MKVTSPIFFLSEAIKSEMVQFAEDKIFRFANSLVAKINKDFENEPNPMIRAKAFKDSQNILTKPIYLFGNETHPVTAVRNTLGVCGEATRATEAAIDEVEFLINRYCSNVGANFVTGHSLKFDNGNIVGCVHAALPGSSEITAIAVDIAWKLVPSKGKTSGVMKSEIKHFLA